MFHYKSVVNYYFRQTIDKNDYTVVGLCLLTFVRLNKWLQFMSMVVPLISVVMSNIQSILEKVIAVNNKAPLANIADALGLPVQSLNLKLTSLPEDLRNTAITGEKIGTVAQSKLYNFTRKRVQQTPLYYVDKTLELYFYALELHKKEIERNRKRRGY
jgi:hypothetical protein